MNFQRPLPSTTPKAFCHTAIDEDSLIPFALPTFCLSPFVIIMYQSLRCHFLAHMLEFTQTEVLFSQWENYVHPSVKTWWVERLGGTVWRHHSGPKVVGSTNLPMGDGSFRCPPVHIFCSLHNHQCNRPSPPTTCQIPWGEAFEVVRAPLILPT